MTQNFELQPTLSGERVRLRPIRSDDRAAMFAAAADPEIWQLHPDNTRHTAAGFARYFDGAIASGSAFSIVSQKNGDIIGSSRFHGHDPARSEIEIGWTFLTREYWGGDYNREVKALMLAHAFRFVDTVVFWVGENNVRSRRAMEKLGATLRDGFVRRVPDEARRHVVYEIRRC